MKKLFKHILSTEDVKGIMLFSFEGELIFKKFSSPLSEEPKGSARWLNVINSLKGVKEVDVIFEKTRLYARRTEHGYLLILMGIFAPIAMIRLNCDVLLSSSKQMGIIKGLRGLLKKAN